jgi:translation elongation factor EF-Ts
VATKQPRRLRRDEAAKVAHRTAVKGLVGTSVLSHGTDSSPGGVCVAALVEPHCETDFLGRTAAFLAGYVVKIERYEYQKTYARIRVARYLRKLEL